MLSYKKLLFQKSLWKDYVRREIPVPYVLNLKQPFFVVGSSRSGTTILAKVLGKSPDVYTFTENNIVRRHMWRMVKNPATLDTEIQQLRKTIVRLSGFDNQKRLLEKTPGHSLLTMPLANYFLDAQFVHIVRDGRDVAFSMLKHEWIVNELRENNEVFWFNLLPETYQSKWEDFDLWQRAILRWALYVSKAREISGYEDRYLEIGYEELCEEPQICLDRILSFLKLPVFPEFKEYYALIKPSKNSWRNKGLKPSQIQFYERAIIEFDLTNVVANDR